jgi:hypothetical protein|eukprot:COSAG01_NODE_12628_length_1709_cov_1.169565_1_plen_59_part_00
MEALYFGSDIGWNREGKNGINGLNTTGGPMDHGPWIGADIENGMYHLRNISMAIEILD